MNSTSWLDDPKAKFLWHLDNNLITKSFEGLGNVNLAAWALHERCLQLRGRLSNWADGTSAAAFARPRWRAADNWRAYVCADQRIQKGGRA